METRVAEVAEGVHQLTTHVAEIGLGFNQYLIGGDEPMLFHTGMRGLFPLVSDAVSQVLPLASLRWVSFGHVEADECGSMNQFLAAAPHAPGEFAPQLARHAPTTWRGPLGWRERRTVPLDREPASTRATR